MLRELTAEARLHLRARVVARPATGRIHTFFAYSAMALIAAVVFGTISVSPF
jgi:hypothetical protein